MPVGYIICGSCKDIMESGKEKERISTTPLAIGRNIKEYVCEKCAAGLVKLEVSTSEEPEP